jgi:hypothetical protein
VCAAKDPHVFRPFASHSYLFNRIADLITSVHEHARERYCSARMCINGGSYSIIITIYFCMIPCPRFENASDETVKLSCDLITTGENTLGSRTGYNHECICASANVSRNLCAKKNDAPVLVVGFEAFGGSGSG